MHRLSPDDQDGFDALVAQTASARELQGVLERLRAVEIEYETVAERGFGHSFWLTRVGKVLYVLLGLLGEADPPVRVPVAYVWVRADRAEEARTAIGS